MSQGRSMYELLPQALPIQKLLVMTANLWVSEGFLPLVLKKCQCTTLPLKICQLPYVLTCQDLSSAACHVGIIKASMSS